MKLDNNIEPNNLDDLLMLLKSLETSETAAMTIISYLGMDEEKIESMIESIIDRYEKKGKVKEEELLKMTVMITCRKEQNIEAN